MFPILTLADLAGLAALFLICASSFAILFRRWMIAKTRNLTLVRWTHLSLSAAAAASLTVHVVLSLGFPLTAGVLLGYAAFGTSVLVWLTGGAFVERVRGTLTLHGQFTIIMISLVLVHAAATSVALAPFSPVVFGCVALLGLVNGVYHLTKLGECLRG